MSTLKHNSKIPNTPPIKNVESMSPFLEYGLINYGRSYAMLVFQLRPLKNGSLYFLYFEVFIEPPRHSVRKQSHIEKSRTVVLVIILPEVPKNSPLSTSRYESEQVFK